MYFSVKYEASASTYLDQVSLQAPTSCPTLTVLVNKHSHTPFKSHMKSTVWNGKFTFKLIHNQWQIEHMFMYMNKLQATTEKEIQLWVYKVNCVCTAVPSNWWWISPLKSLVKRQKDCHLSAVHFLAAAHSCAFWRCTFRTRSSILS